MFGIYQKAKAEAGYTATVFLNMLHRQKGILTAKQLINAPRVSDGYTALYIAERLDLTVEAMVIENSQWHVLFEPEELQRARNRLEQYNYKFSS